MDKWVRDPRLTDVDIHDFSGIMRSIMVVQSRGINGVVIHGQVTCTDVQACRPQLAQKGGRTEAEPSVNIEATAPGSGEEEQPSTYASASSLDKKTA